MLFFYCCYKYFLHFPLHFSSSSEDSGFHFWIRLCLLSAHVVWCVLCAKLLQLCTIPCNAMDCSRSGCSVHGILQARTLVWDVGPSSRGSSQSRDWTYVFYVSCIGRQALYHWHHLADYIYVCVCMSVCVRVCVHISESLLYLKLTQYCKTTILQFKKEGVLPWLFCQQDTECRHISGVSLESVLWQTTCDMNKVL